MMQPKSAYNQTTATPYQKSRAGRPAAIPKILTGEQKRLLQVIDEFGGTYDDFAGIVGVKSGGTVSKWASGKMPVPGYAMKAIAHRLGYSTEWLIFGTGKRKAKLEDVKTITELKELRQEMKMMLLENKAMKERMTHYEQKMGEYEAELASMKANFKK